MKNLNLLSTFLIISSLATTTAFAGPIGSGGPQGQQFLQCEGATESAGNVYLSVAVRPVPEVGLYAHIVNEAGQIIIDAKVQRDEDDPQGLKYFNDSISILVPNIQSPKRDPGTYSALVTSAALNDGDAVVFHCSAQ